jgi:hypothetical protein
MNFVEKFYAHLKYVNIRKNKNIRKQTDNYCFQVLILEYVYFKIITIFFMILFWIFTLYLHNYQKYVIFKKM